MALRKQLLRGCVLSCLDAFQEVHPRRCTRDAVTKQRCTRDAVTKQPRRGGRGMGFARLYTTLNSPTQSFGDYTCTIDNHTFSPTNVCTNTRTAITTITHPTDGAFHVESQELPLIKKWPGIADCLGKEHGDQCWKQWDV